MTKQFAATYTSVDGVRKSAKFATIAGLAAFVNKWAGPNINGNTAISNDGVGKVVFNGATAEQVLEALAPTPTAPVAPAPVAAAPAPVEAPAAPVVQQATVAVRALGLRGATAVVAIAPGKPYRVQAGHCADWYKRIRAKWEEQGTTTVAAVLEAGVPSHFVGYMLRRGWAVAA